jgi:hypothetical protein
MHPLHWIYINREFLQALSGLTIAVLGVLTLFVLMYQANEMRKATEAMRDNTKVLVESQKPRIAARAHGNPTLDLADRAAPRVQIELANTGASPAYDLTWETWIELLTFPFVDFTAAVQHETFTDRSVMYPNHDPVMINIPIRKGITMAELLGLQSLRLFACFRVRVKYRDAFSPTVANFGFYVMGNGLGYLPKYNDVSDSAT